MLNNLREKSREREVKLFKSDPDGKWPKKP